MITEAPAALAFWLAWITGRMDVCIAIAADHAPAAAAPSQQKLTHRSIAHLRIAASHGHRINAEGFIDD